MKKSERGIYLILTVVALPLLLALGVFSYDLGRLYLVRSKLQNISDLAALAGMRQYLNDLEGGLASTSQNNVFHAADVTIQTNDSAKSAASAIDVRGIRTGKYDPAANPTFQALNIQNAEINAVQVEVSKNTGSFLFKYFFGGGAKHDIAVKATVEVKCSEGFKWGGERCCPSDMKWDGAQKKCIGECPPTYKPDPVPGNPLRCTKEVTTTTTETTFECPSPECAQPPPPSDKEELIEGHPIPFMFHAGRLDDPEIQKGFYCPAGYQEVTLSPNCPVWEGRTRADDVWSKNNDSRKACWYTRDKIYIFLMCKKKAGAAPATPSLAPTCKDLPQNATACPNAQQGLTQDKVYLLIDSSSQCIAGQCQAYCDASKSLVREGNKCVTKKKEEPAAPAPVAVTCTGTAGSGRDVHWTASASGGSGNYEYDWGIEIGGSKMFSGWSSSSSRDLPSSPPVIVMVRDKKNPSQTSSAGCTAA